MSRPNERFAKAEHGFSREAENNNGVIALEHLTGGQLDHELLRSLILELRASTATEDYVQIDREDRVKAASISARYLMNRWMRVELGYRYTDRNVDPPDVGRGFTRNLFSLTFIGQM